MEYLQYAYEKIFGADNSTDVTQGVYYTPRKVVCFGNVLLDRIVKLDNPDLLESYKLELGSKGEIDLETLNKIILESTNSSSCLSNPGGSALNTVRILKHLGTDAQFFGAIGNDKNGEHLRTLIAERGIEARLQIIEDVPTGQCVCLMHNDSPTLYANIGASANFSVQQLTHTAVDKTQSFLRPIERKQVIYIEGFFVPQRTDVLEYILRDVVRERRHLAVNLSAPYIVKQNTQMMLKLAHRAMFVFGNRQEFEELAKAAGYDGVEELGYKLLDAAVPKIILVTDGATGVQLITNYQEELLPSGLPRFEDFRAQRVDAVVDATGAGDSFVAGFLHGWLEKRSVDECVRMATTVASKVVTQVGCNLP